jgi:hypothetical protein
MVVLRPETGNTGRLEKTVQREVHGFIFPPDFIRVVKSKKKRWAKHVER